MAIRWEIPLEPLIKKIVFKERERQINQQEWYIAREDISDSHVKDTILNFASLIKKSYANLTNETSKARILAE